MDNQNTKNMLLGALSIAYVLILVLMDNQNTRNGKKRPWVNFRLNPCSNG